MPVGIKPGRDYPRAPDGGSAVRPFAGGHGGTICPQLEIALPQSRSELLFISANSSLVANRVPRHPEVPRDLFDRLALDEVAGHPEFGRKLNGSPAGTGELGANASRHRGEPDCRSIRNRQRSTPCAPPPLQQNRRSPTMTARIPRLVLGRADACVVSLIGHHFVMSGARRRSRRGLSRKRTASECRCRGYCYNQPFHANSPVELNYESEAASVRPRRPARPELFAGA
jgi:hypothetical protein